MTHACHPCTGEVEFKVTLCYKVSLRPAWATLKSCVKTYQNSLWCTSPSSSSQQFWWRLSPSHTWATGSILLPLAPFNYSTTLLLASGRNFQSTALMFPLLKISKLMAPPCTINISFWVFFNSSGFCLPLFPLGIHLSSRPFCAHTRHFWPQRCKHDFRRRCCSITRRNSDSQAECAIYFMKYIVLGMERQS